MFDYVTFSFSFNLISPLHEAIKTQVDVFQLFFTAGALSAVMEVSFYPLHSNISRLRLRTLMLLPKYYLSVHIHTYAHTHTSKFTLALYD